MLSIVITTAIERWAIKTCKDYGTLRRVPYFYSQFFATFLPAENALKKKYLLLKPILLSVCRKLSNMGETALKL